MGPGFWLVKIVRGVLGGRIWHQIRKCEVPHKKHTPMKQWHKVKLGASELPFFLSSLSIDTPNLALPPISHIFGIYHDPADGVPH